MNNQNKKNFGFGQPVPTAQARAAKGHSSSFKRRIKMIRAARLEAALYKDTVIATFLNITPAGLAQMKQDPEYDQIRMQVLTGVASDAEKEYLNDVQYKHELIREMVPLALQNLYDLARSQNENIKYKATTEILDREGTLAKVSRIGLATADQGGAGTTIDDEMAASLMNVIKLQRERDKESSKSDEKGQNTASSTTIQ